MIRRHYFISAEKPHNNGTLGYAFQSTTLSYTSWLADPLKVYKEGCEYLKESMKDVKGGAINIVSFNRI